jgi:hypothetical protein
MYAIEWSAITNIGIDLLAVPLTRLFPAEIVGKLYHGAGILLVRSAWRCCTGRCMAASTGGCWPSRCWFGTARCWRDC